MSELNLNGPEWTEDTSIDSFKQEVEKIPQELVFLKYLGPTFKVGGLTFSPFRSEKSPSFGVYRDGDYLIFNDLGNKDSGTTFDFLLKYYKDILQLDTIPEMMKRFKEDMGKLSHESPDMCIYYKSKEIKKAQGKSESNFKLEIKVREFNQSDITYWGAFGINIRVLKIFNVFPISHYYVNGKGFIAERLAYAYLENKDGEITIKIYQPNNKKMKWLANINFSIHQGYRQLPATGDLLVITKALKDVMSLYATLGVNAIGVQGEKSRMKLSVVEEYKSRFTTVLTFFDNDRAGRELFDFFKTNYDIDGILIPEVHKQKDYSDLIKYYGVLQARAIVGKLLKDKIKKHECYKNT